MSKAFAKYSAMILAAAVLTGCASPGAYKMYDGAQKPATETAVVTFPYVLDVIALDGEKAEIPSSVRNSEATYELTLLPGHHDMAVRYDDPFADYEDQYRSTSGDNRVSRTSPFFLTFDLVAGGRYAVEYQTAKQNSALKRNEVQAWVVDAGSGDTVGKMSDEKKRVEKGASTEPAEVASTSVKEAVVASTDGETPKQLPSIKESDQLKFWWYRAGPEERKEFLRWMSEEKE